MSMSAMILAAGRGSRMRPLTDHIPKPLLKIGNKPLIVWHIERLANAGITHIVINHAWLGQQIEALLGDGTQFGVHIQYSAESQALETAAGIKKALPLLHAHSDHNSGDVPFLVISADVWTDWPATMAFSMVNSLAQHQALAHLLLATNPEHNAEGDFCLKQMHLQLKDSTTPKNQSYTYSGIGVFSPHFFAKVQADTPTALRIPLQHAINQGQVLGTVYQGKWADIGTPERLRTVEQGLAQQS